MGERTDRVKALARRGMGSLLQKEMFEKDTAGRLGIWKGTRFADEVVGVRTVSFTIPFIHSVYWRGAGCLVSGPGASFVPLNFNTKTAIGHYARPSHT